MPPIISDSGGWVTHTQDPELSSLSLDHLPGSVILVVLWFFWPLWFPSLPSLLSDARFVRSSYYKRSSFSDTATDGMFADFSSCLNCKEGRKCQPEISFISEFHCCRLLLWPDMSGRLDTCSILLGMSAMLAIRSRQNVSIICLLYHKYNLLLGGRKQLFTPYV